MTWSMCRLASCTRSMSVCLVELQEQEDLSILLEWRDFDLDGECARHLGLGFNLALEAVECRSRSGEELRQLIRSAGFGSSVLPDAADPYSRLENVALNGQTTLDSGFAVLVMLTGEADLEGGRAVHLRGGNTAVCRTHSAQSYSTVAVSFWPTGHPGRGEAPNRFGERRDLLGLRPSPAVDEARQAASSAEARCCSTGPQGPAAGLIS